MKRLSPFQFLLCLLPLAFTTCQNTEQTTKSQAVSSQHPKLDTFFQKLADHDKMHGAVAVWENGELSHNAGYGFARMHAGDTVPANYQTRYQIGSITKTYTAVLIMQLVEEGKLNLDTKLAEFYPDIPNADSITIEQMLRHRSGLYNYTDSSWMEWRDQNRSKAEMIALFQSQEPEFEPGEKFQYSNTNYVLLGYITEELTGKSFGEALEARIIEPLGLKDTYFPNSNQQKLTTRSYQWNGEAWDTMKQTNHQVSHGADGALVATPADVIKFYKGLFQGKLVDSGSLAQMTTMEKGLSKGNPYGLGLIQMPFGKKKAYGHTGGIDGFRAQAAYFPEDSLGVALATNALNYNLNQIMIGLLSIVYDRDYEIPEFDQEKVSLSNEQMKAFTGFYKSDQLPLDITLRFKNGQLKGQATNQPEFPLTPVSDTSFKNSQAGLEIRFKKPEKGEFKEFYLIQMGQRYLFEKAAK